MRAKHTLILFAFFLIGLTALQAQEEPLNSVTVESRSYQLYLDKNWKELCSFGNKAIAQDFDYYFLRLRIGIAYFERTDYYMAEKHFKKALGFNASDPLSQEYLYYCYLYTSRYEDAKWLSKSFSDELAKRLGTDHGSPVTYMGFEGGMKIPSARDTFNVGKFFQVGLGHYIFKRISFYHSFNYYNQQSYASTHSGNVALNPQNHYDTIQRRQYHVAKGTQLHYFLKANIPFKNNFLLSASAHYLPDFTTNENYDTTRTVHEAPPAGMPKPPVDVSDTLVTNKKNHPSYLVTLALRKRIAHIEVWLGFTYNHVDVVTQYQENIGIEYHPTGNDKLAFGINGYMHTENSFAKNSYAVAPYVSFRPVNKLTVGLDYMYNTDNNIVEFSGYYVNNSRFFTKYRSAVSLPYQSSSKLIVYGNYAYEHKYVSGNNFDFNNNIFLIGITMIL